MSKSESVIILVNYNSWKDTLECIASLSLIKIRRFSVIVVDNCSIDDSYMKLKEELIKYPFVVLLKSEFNGGFAKGNNIAISYARKNIKPQYLSLIHI